MIIAALFGGLGNQMFQYANARALSLRNHVSFKVDTQYLHPKYLQKAKATARNYELSVFNFNVKNAGWFYVNLYAPFISLKTKYSFAFNKLYNPLFINENKMFSYQPIPNRKLLYLYGYWQSWKYFIDFENEIRTDFIFSKELIDRNLEISKQIDASNSISVHLRLGDYEPKNILPMKYYMDAVDLMNQKFKNAIFYIFSDNIQQDSKYFKGHNFILLNNNIGNDSYIDMQLMSRCKHHIIANSSFSWWGAWLNNRPDKVVIAPSVWYNNTTNTNDILPPEWIRI